MFDEPPFAASVTVAPGIGLLWASATVTVIVAFAGASVLAVPLEATIVECEASTAPGTNATVVWAVIATPFSVPVMVAVPAVVEEVRVAV